MADKIYIRAWSQAMRNQHGGTKINTDDRLRGFATGYMHKTAGIGTDILGAIPFAGPVAAALGADPENKARAFVGSTAGQLLGAPAQILASRPRVTGWAKGGKSKYGGLSVLKMLVTLLGRGGQAIGGGAMTHMATLNPKDLSKYRRSKAFQNPFDTP